MSKQRIRALTIEGYRPFGQFTAKFDSLEVIAGANGAGKTSLFEFLRFLRNGMYGELPSEIVAGTIGQEIFHRPGPDRFEWKVDIDTGIPEGLAYSGQVLGPIGSTKVTLEKVELNMLLPSHDRPLSLLEVRGNRGKNYERSAGGPVTLEEPVEKKRWNQLTLASVSPRFVALSNLRDYIQGWRFYSSFNIDQQKIREAGVTEEEPLLREDASNLAAVIHYLYTEHPQILDELQVHLRSLVPGFRRLSVKSRGGPGRIMVFWEETGIDQPLTLADISDGTLRLLCWLTLALAPNCPSLVCIDEPDQGVHPRTLPKLAGLFEKLSQRTQVLLATHASYFLLQFGFARLAVMRKENGQAVFVKPRDSAILKENLADFGVEEIERMHQSDELERLA